MTGLMADKRAVLARRLRGVRRSRMGMPAGESLVWALAKEAGGFDDRLRYPGEDSTYEIPRMDAMLL
jgi:hypothetical protein